MIEKTVTGVIVPIISTNQLPRYEMRANTLMKDLHKSITDSSAAEAITQKGVSDIKEGQQIATSAAQKAKNHQPHHIDEWA